MSWLFFAGILVIRFNEQLAVPLQSVVAPALVFATVIVLLNIAFGMYRRADKLTSSTYLVRMLLVPAIGVPLAYLIVSALPTGRLLQNNLGMGIGVYESAQYLKSVGGEIRVDSVPGAGTSVRVLLPLSDAAEAVQ